MMRGSHAIVVAAIGTTQTIAWASSYYMPAILGAPIAAALHLPSSVFFGLFSGALLLSAVVGPSVGRLIDTQGGRSVLAASNLVIAVGLMILAAAQSIAGLVIAWTVLGVGIGMGLYDPAFAALTWLYGREARSSITGITLIAGFASTIGWPLSAWFLHELDWRAACLIWAGQNALLATPLNWLTIPRHTTSAALPRVASELQVVEPPRAAMPMLAFFFSATWFVQGAMAAHLPALLQAAGASAPAAIAAAALVGPAQVGARIVEFGVLHSFHPVSLVRFASALHPLGAAFLVVLGAPGIVAFALLHGAGNGMITISKGTLPLALFGPQGYGVRSGLLSAQARMLKAASSFLFGLLLDRVGIGAVGLSAGLCLAACGSLFLLRPRRTVGAPFTGAQLNAVAYLLAFAALPGAPARSAWGDQLVASLIERKEIMSSDCYACRLTEGVEPLPGGRIYATEHWVVEHCTGPLGVGTLIVKPFRHCLHIGDLTAAEAQEVGPLVQRVSHTVQALTRADQVYVCLWSHAGWQPGHIHFVVQPAWNEWRGAFGRPGPFVQAAMFQTGNAPPVEDVEKICVQVKKLLQ